MSQPSKTLTISIPRSALGHVLLGLGVAVIACAAFVAYAHLPPVGYPLRGVLLGLGVVGSCVALAYWLWCTLQCIKADGDTGHEATHEALQILRDAEHERAEAAAARESAILTAVEQLQADQKQLVETVDALADAVEILRDCYLEEGRVQDHHRPQGAPPREP